MARIFLWRMCLYFCTGYLKSLLCFYRVCVRCLYSLKICERTHVFGTRSVKWILYFFWMTCDRSPLLCARSMNCIIYFCRRTVRFVNFVFLIIFLIWTYGYNESHTFLRLHVFSIKYTAYTYKNLREYEKIIMSFDRCIHKHSCH